MDTKKNKGIEVTDEMIEAGAKVYENWADELDYDLYDVPPAPGEFLKSIYLNMVHSRENNSK